MRRIALISALAALMAVSACTDGLGLKAKRVERQDELIGGPTAKGKIGDYLLENDKVRVVISAPGATFTAGLFGGTVLDVDLQRSESQYRNGRGFDSFGEAFPLANLLIPNPMNPLQIVKATDAGFELQPIEGAVKVLKDGSDGSEAVIRVEGHSAYIFDVLKFLNRDFIDGLLNPLKLAGLELFAQDLADLLPGVLEEPDLNLFGLLNRLQISFDFTTDYTLRPGESFLRQSTTVSLAPQSATLLKGCPPVTCNTQCQYGFAVAELSEDNGGATPYKRMCPVCACAAEPAQMATFNESRDFFSVILGSPKGWVDPNWRGGVVVGDFLFYGSDAPPFAPGFGFDVDRKIYENMWQGVGTMGSPLSMDWLAGVGENVSYAWTTINPNERQGFDCKSHRLSVVQVTGDEDAVAAAIAGQADFDLAPEIALKDAAARVRQAIVDRRPIPLITVTTDLSKDPGADAPVEQRAAAYSTWVAGVMQAQGNALATRLGGSVSVDLLPAFDCLPSKVLVPLFTTSATAVLTHFAEGDRLVTQPDGTTVQDDRHGYYFERFLTVGEGDVASAVKHVYALRNTPVGSVTGTVFEKGSMVPLDHVSVFVLKDPRKDLSTPVPATWAEYRNLAQKEFASSGLTTQMLTDVGIRPDFSGGFDGMVPPDRYFLMAHSRERGESALEPVIVRTGETVRANLLLPAPGSIEFRITDQTGMLVPSRVSFQRIDESGKLLDWDGSNEPELGDSRYDHGVTKVEHSIDGTGLVPMAPGHYRVTASRGLEYGISVLEDIEVRPGQSLPLRVSILREVDTPNHVGADFHVHAGRSTDASLPMDVRVRTAAAEGVEFFAATDHDDAVDYMPYILKDGLESFFKFELSVEISPLEYGHYIGFPLTYDATKGFMHDPPAWHGLTLFQMFQDIRKRMDGPKDAFTLQVNHPRDGFMGYFAQIGMKGYDLSRKTPGMEMCNQVMEEAPCDFDGIEIMNGKNLQYLHTPTVGEVERHNVCYREIIATRDKTKLPYNGTDSVCAWLLADPTANCAEAATKADDRTQPEDERGNWVVLRDHCRWHQEARAEFDACTPDKSLLECKRRALEGLKSMSVRYMVERTTEENDVYFNTVSEEAAAIDPTKPADIGCSQKDACLTCVQKTHPECGKAVKDGGIGWAPQCVLWCRDECPLDDVRPCTDRFEVLEDWFHFLDVGFNVTGVGNSDSHGISKEIGHPRTYVEVGTDLPGAIDRDRLNRAYKAGRATVSAGTYVEMTLREEGSDVLATIGDTLKATGSGKLVAHLRVQTPSWFRADRVEIWSNSKLIKRIFTDSTPEDIVDFEGDVQLDRPAKDAWYLAIAYGTETADTLSPVYKREPYGNILISTVLALAADQILASFASLLDKVAVLGLDVSSLTGSTELPDSYPSFPWGATNPIRVDLAGDGFTPPRAVDTNNDGKWDLPAFCSRPCDISKESADCPTGQTCAVRRGTDGSAGGAVYVCQVPTPSYCAGLQKISPDK
jgi:hypothetical protein